MARGTVRLWARWSWRDLRRRSWLVLAIALVIGLGTGTYAGLGSTAAWRRLSNDESFALLRMHDLRVTLAQGAAVEQGRLRDVVAGIPHASSIEAADERLVGNAPVDASTSEETILVPGEVVGVDVAGSVDLVHAYQGRTLGRDDDGRPVAVLEYRFAQHYDLAATGTFTLGATAVDYVGVGTSPEHFIVVGRSRTMFAEGSLAVVFLPMRTAQELLGLRGMVNELAVRVRDGADREIVRNEIAAAFPGGGVTITAREDEPAYRILYEDIENDQKFWNIVAFLILSGAAFAAFNLTTRMVEAGRREIGIGMAIGVRPGRLALRPLLVGVQVAAWGTAAGVLVGLGLDQWLRSVFTALLPLPVFRTPFQPDVFARAAVLGLLLPLVGTMLPVWRAVRMAPVDAIRTGHLAVRSTGLVRLGRRFHLRGRSYRRMPLRNLLRAPRRTLLTALAIGAAVTTVVAVLGMVDSFFGMLDRGEAETGRMAPDRYTVELATFQPADGATPAAVAASPVVGEARAGLRLLGTVPRSGADDDIDVVVDLLDFDTAMWSPTLENGGLDRVRGGGIVLSEKAADDLGLRVGDTVALRHPVRVGTTFTLAESRLVVADTHPGPLRMNAYLDLSQASRFGMEGLANVIDVLPRDGVADAELKRALATLPGVASVQSVSAVTRLLRNTMDEFFGVLRVTELIVLALAVLIAFNSAGISVDERAREHATMLAFGLRPRTVLGLLTVEGVATGVLGATVGIGLGWAVVRWTFATQLDQTMPDIRIEGVLSPGTMATAFALGVIAVAVAPLLAGRRVRRMDIPATLRVME